LEQYGASIDKPQVCPGEENCQRFQSARGKGRIEKQRNACRPCELFDTKRERYRKSQKGLSDLVEYSQYARRRRESGYPMPLDQISDLMLETMLRIDEMHDHEERNLRIETKNARSVGLGLKVQ